MQCAVIDIGTNTFHLIIAKRSDSTPIDLLYKETIPVRLGEDSFPEGNGSYGTFSKNFFLYLSGDAMEWLDHFV